VSDLRAFTVPPVLDASYPVRPGNLLQPLIDGEPAFRRVCEAIESARERVWVTVTFLWSSFRMPDGRGTALDVLNRAALAVWTCDSFSGDRTGKPSI
jgi:cardiolipin synthase